MKENKFFIVLLIMIFIIFSICVFFVIRKPKNELKSDAVLIKEEYSTLNGNDDYVYVDLNDSNHFVYRSDEDIIKMLESKTGLVFFGSASSNLSRSVISKLDEVAYNLKYPQIAYYDVSKIRDVLELDENHKVITRKEGTHTYNKMLELLGDNISDYILVNSDGTKVNTGEKRIYLGTFVAILNGEVVGVHEISFDENTIVSDSELNNLSQIYKAMIEKVTEESCSEAC